MISMEMHNHDKLRRRVRPSCLSTYAHYIWTRGFRAFVDVHIVVCATIGIFQLKDPKRNVHTVFVWCGDVPRAVHVVLIVCRSDCDHRGRCRDGGDGCTGCRCEWSCILEDEDDCDTSSGELGERHLWLSERCTKRVVEDASLLVSRMSGNVRTGMCGRDVWGSGKGEKRDGQKRRMNRKEEKKQTDEEE